MLIDRTEWAIIHRGPLTATGYDEIQVRTILKRTAEKILKDEYGSLSKARRQAYEIRKISGRVI